MKIFQKKPKPRKQKFVVVLSAKEAGELRDYLDDSSFKTVARKFCDKYDSLTIEGR